MAKSRLSPLPCAFLLSIALSAWQGSAQALTEHEIHTARPVSIFATGTTATDIIPCAGVLVSRTHLLHPDCSESSRPTNSRVLFGNEVPSSPFVVSGRALESGAGWQISRVEGRPSQFFGIASLGKAPDAGHLIQVLTFVKTSDGNAVRKHFKLCTVGRFVEGSVKRFTYSCEKDDVADPPYPEFIFDNSEGHLIALGQKSQAGAKLAIPIVEVRRRSKVLGQIKVDEPLPDYGAALHLNCEKAGYYASHPEQLLALSSSKYDEVAIVLRGCAEQIAANKWKPPESRSVTVIRTTRRPDWSNEYTFHSVTKEDINQIVYACWFGGDGKSFVELFASQQLWPDKPWGCSGIFEGMKSNEPFLLNPTDNVNEKAYYDHPGTMFGDPAKIIGAWADNAVIAKIDPKESQKDPRIVVGPIYERCLISWDDSFNFHSLRFEGIRPVTKMKKLRHCIKLTATGPVDAKHIAKEYISSCVNKALNDDKVRHILTLILGIAADVLSAGATGGAGTIGAISDYVVEVQERSLSCLTDEKNLERFVVDTLRGTFGADVSNESHWIYWDV